MHEATSIRASISAKRPLKVEPNKNQLVRTVLFHPIHVTPAQLIMHVAGSVCTCKFFSPSHVRHTKQSAAIIN